MNSIYSGLSSVDGGESSDGSDHHWGRNSRRDSRRLKQRTSSVDIRKDYSYFSTWYSLKHLLKWREVIICVNNFPIWRRHLAWAMEHGADLRNYLTQRFAASMVFLSLMLSAELGVLFNSSQVTTLIRKAMQNEEHFTLQFWVGVTILISIILTLLSLITTFTAWGMVSAISDENAHCILRSSIGQYAGELPQRFVVASIYSFLIWFGLMIFVLIPVGFWSILLVTSVLILFVHVVTVFSVLGRLILHTTAMAPTRIFDEVYEHALTPQPLQQQLCRKAMAELENATSITRQYRRKMKPLDRPYDTTEELAAHMKRESYNSRRKRQENNSDATAPPAPSRRLETVTTANNNAAEEAKNHHRRKSSTVRFADEIFASAMPSRDDHPLLGSNPLSPMSETSATTSPSSYGRPKRGGASPSSVLRKTGRPSGPRFDFNQMDKTTNGTNAASSFMARTSVKSSSYSKNSKESESSPASPLSRPPRHHKKLPPSEVTTKSRDHSRTLSSAEISDIYGSYGGSEDAEDDPDDLMKLYYDLSSPNSGRATMTDSQKFDEDYGDLGVGPSSSKEEYDDDYGDWRKWATTTTDTTSIPIENRGSLDFSIASTVLNGNKHTDSGVTTTTDEANETQHLLGQPTAKYASTFDDVL